MLNFGNEFEAREGKNDASLGCSSVIERSRNEHALSSSLASHCIRSTALASIASNDHRGSSPSVRMTASKHRWKHRPKH